MRKDRHQVLVTFFFFNSSKKRSKVELLFTGWKINLFVTCPGLQRVNGINAQ